jgi:hypothetical protein
MKIGAITDSLGALSFDELLGTAAELGIERSEFVPGRWSKRAARPNLRTCRRFRICSLNSGCSAICRAAVTGPKRISAGRYCDRSDAQSQFSRRMRKRTRFLVPTGQRQ